MNLAVIKSIAVGAVKSVAVRVAAKRLIFAGLERAAGQSKYPLVTGALVALVEAAFTGDDDLFARRLDYLAAIVRGGKRGR